MRKRRNGWLCRVLSASTLVCMAGCAPAIRLPTPDTSLPAEFEREPRAESKSTLQLDRWWDGFDDAQLGQLIETALDRSTTARLAYARIIEARAARRQTTAATLPTGNLSASATEQGSREIWGTGATQAGQASYQASFNPSWEIDLFGRLAAIRDRADLDYRASALDFYATRMALASDVATALFQARFLAVQLGNARDTFRISSDLAASARLGLARGLTSEQDYARLQADVDSSQAEVTRLEGELRAAKRSLLILVGEPVQPTDSMAVAAVLDPPPKLPAATPGLLLARRPDVLGAQAGLEGAARTVEIDRLALFPRFTIQPGSTLAVSDGGGTGLWSIAAGLTAPVLDRARLLAALRVSEARGHQAVISYEQAVQTAFGEAENALTRLDADGARIDRLANAADLSRKAFIAARLGYSSGLTDLTTLLQAERSWLQNRAALDAVRYSLLAGTITAIRALGGGWDPRDDLSPRAPLPLDTKAL